MIEHRLHDQLQHVGRRLRRLRWASVVALVCMLAALSGGGLLVAAKLLGPPPIWAAAALSLAALLAALAASWRVLRRPIDPVDTARHVEAFYPELQSKLITAAEQRPDDDHQHLNYLQTVIVGESAAHGRRTGWARVASYRRTLLVGGQLSSAVILLVVMLGLLWNEQQNATDVRSPGGVPLPGRQYTLTVEPGDTELERGSSLLVLARFRGPLPSDVAIVHQPARGGQSRRQPLAKSLDDPLFAGHVADVQNDLTYRIEYAGRQSPTYRVTVFDYPELERADFKLVFPAYTAEPDALIEDVRQVTAVEGTKLTLIAQLNKEVAQARLVADAGKPIPLTADAERKNVYTASWPLVKTGRYKLELVDRQNRKNKEPPDFTFAVVPNRPPAIKLVFPSRDVQVSPLEEIELAASVWDDFGVPTYGIAYSFDGQPLKEIVLGDKVPAKQRRDARRLISFEMLSAQPDQLLSYYFFADDVGPDGRARRTQSDMFFCEVRPFEEIFRQGEEPPGGSSQQSGGEADKLADLQKQVINATWKLIRRETAAEPSAEFAADAGELLAGQQEVVRLADELGPKLRSPEARAALQVARRHMKQALEQLQPAAEKSSIAPLTPALAAEQAAYQALLKLRAREHEIIRGSKSRGGRSGGNRSSEQLNELELKESENRYEQQRTAQQMQDETQRERRHVLNRLRELAERQGDLNKQIAEMQSAMQAAQTADAREEIRRQLKRLRDEEQQILRDADELRNRMQQPANQQRMAEAQRQLDETRSNVRRAAEALAAGQPSQAAAAGSRAQRQLSELREQFRKQAAGRFQDEMRELRNTSRGLVERERELGRQMSELDKPQSPSLRPQAGREKLAEQFGQQHQQLDKLMERMRGMVEEAEKSEPLLSKQLYETIRQAHHQRPGETLDLTRQLLERGFVAEAARSEESARSGLGKLHEGIERAAKSVLGDETEALRQARDRVDELARALDQEIDRATGKPPAQPGKASAAASGSKAASPGRQPADSSAPPTGSTAETGASADNSGNPPARESQPANDNSNQRPADGQRTPGRDGLRNLAERMGSNSGPLTGGDFRRWSDDLRDVEEMLGDPQLRSRVAQVRDRASAMRAEFKRHSQAPNWGLVRETLSMPLVELRERLVEELLRRESKDALVPLDRDPVPPKYSEQVRRYYQRLGSGR